MKNNIQIDQEHENIVSDILTKHLSNDVSVWVFGSRATNNAKPYSDLDLALQAPLNSQTIINTKLLTNLEQEFEESDLPWKVDIINLDDVNESFRNIINKEKKQYIFYSEEKRTR